MPAYDIGPRIGIEGEKEFRNSIKAIDSEVRALGNELKTLSKEYDKNDTSIEGVTKKQQTLNKAIGAAKDQIKLLSSQYDKQYQELKRLETALDSARKLHGENSEEALRAEAALAKQAKTVNDLGARLERAKGRLITFENQMEELGNSATRAGEQIQNAGEKISGIGGAISNVGNALTVGVTTPILAAATAAVSLGNDFEAQMSRVQAIAGATSTELEALTDQALQLGADTSFSASEVAQGMENLASAGFTVEEIMAAMSGMLDLAASSGADLATSSEIAASAIRGFGLDASDAAHVADVFAEASARTNAQTEDMGEAMKYVAPVASAMSQSLEETAAAIGIMSDAGIKGSQAGTSLRGALSRLAKPTQPVADKMDELGLSFYDAAGNMLPLNEMIEQLQDRFQGLT
jgi:phage-related minor tail protein